MKKFLLTALPLVLLFVSAAIHTCCACPMAFDDQDGPGPAERAILGAAKRKRPRVMARVTRTVIELIFSRIKLHFSGRRSFFVLANIDSENADQIGTWTKEATAIAM
jgi:hypothetical protein